MQKEASQPGEFSADPFEGEVYAYQRSDKLSPPPPNPVLFFGGSSIRFWPLLEYDFPTYPVLNRGFGGARLRDCVRLFPRLVKPYDPKLLIFYAGDNDIGDGRSPQEIISDLRAFVDLVCDDLPGLQIGIISIKPSPARWDHQQKTRKTNNLIRNFVAKHANLSYLNVYDKMLCHKSSSFRSLFLKDGLHMSRMGYDIWRDVVTAYLPTAVKDTVKPSKSYKEAGMNRQHHEWYSPYLSQKMELVVFGDAGPQVIVFPTLYGRFYQYESHGMVQTLRDRLEAGTLQLICVDGLDENILYNTSISPRERIERYMNFEAYILQEVLPFSKNINNTSSVTLHGCSLGAFHAVNIAFRHPDLFSGVLAFSGRYDLTRDIGDAFKGLFDGYYDDDIYFYTPNHFLPNLNDELILQQLRQLRITLTIGEWDAFIDNNRAFSEILSRKGITHDLYVWSGTTRSFLHWRKMVKLYL